MEAKKCDRCGKYYDKNVRHKTCGRIYGGKIAGIVTTDTDGHFDKGYDLCDDCIESFEKWRGLGNGNT